MYMGIESSFCDRPRSVVLLTTLAVYAGGTSIDDRLLTNTPPDEVKRDGKYHYQLALFTEWNKKRRIPDALKKDRSQEYYLTYNLRQEPEDICISVRARHIFRDVELSRLRLSREELRDLVGDRSAAASAE